MTAPRDLHAMVAALDQARREEYRRGQDEEAAKHADCCVDREELDQGRRERDDIAYRVEHPELAHLHYDGCPYKPYAAFGPGDAIPDPEPICTCGEAAKGAYWKGQHMLERGYHKLTQQQVTTLTTERDALRLRVEILEGALRGTVNHWIETETDLQPCWCPIAPETDERVIPHAACLDARAALTPDAGRERTP